MNTLSQAVLITGCGSGVGHAAALAFASAGYPTYATGRNVAELADLQAAGCIVMELDVTNEASRVRVVETIVRQHGAVGILINNAGYAQMGALEELTPTQIQRQFDTNVFGVMRLCQLVLPGMRAQHYGSIVVVGSVGGLLTTPYMGAYHMSKYAIESFCDALRFEVKGFGVNVILMEPHNMKTRFGTASIATLAHAKKPGPYDDIMDRVAAITAKAYQNPRMLEPAYVADVIVQAVRAKRPKTRYKFGLQGRIMPFMRRAMGDRLTDALWQAVLTPKKQK